MDMPWNILFSHNNMLTACTNAELVCYISASFCKKKFQIVKLFHYFLTKVFVFGELRNNLINYRSFGNKNDEFSYVNIYFGKKSAKKHHFSPANPTRTATWWTSGWVWPPRPPRIPSPTCKTGNIPPKTTHIWPKRTHFWPKMAQIRTLTTINRRKITDRKREMVCRISEVFEGISTRIRIRPTTMTRWGKTWKPKRPAWLPAGSRANWWLLARG